MRAWLLFFRLGTFEGLVFALCLTVSCLFGCSGSEPGEGADLLLRVDNAQLVRDEFPSDEGGPEISFTDFRRNSIRPGEGRVPLSGRTEETAFSVRLGLSGDTGYWIIPVGVEDPAVQGELIWGALLNFSKELEGTSLELLVQAVDAQGNGGAVENFIIPLESDQPQEALAVRLEWDASADVDLWLTDPHGMTLSPKNISNVQQSAAGDDQTPPTSPANAGFIDIDSNANCLIDGQQRETASFGVTPPDGTYHVSVDLASPCSTNRTSFSVSIWTHGRLQTSGSGNLYPFDSRKTASGSGTALPVMTFTLQDGKLRLEP